MVFLKGYFFSKLYFKVFGFGLVMFDSFDPKADMHIANVNQRVNDVIFRISELELCLSLFKIPIALFNFILTLDNCLAHCKCSFKSIRRYLTDWAGISHFASTFKLN